MESSVICLRFGATKFMEHRIFKEKVEKAKLMNIWQEIRTISIPNELVNLFIEIHGLKDMDKPSIRKMFEKLRTYFKD